MNKSLPTPANLPPNLTNTCSQLEPILSGAVPLPSAAQVSTALQSGQAPPVPGLALPTLPGPLPGPKAPAGGHR